MAYCHTPINNTEVARNVKVCPLHCRMMIPLSKTVDAYIYLKKKHSEEIVHF